MGDWIVEPLNQGHERADFSSSHASLDDFLKKYAGQHSSDPHHLAIAIETVEEVLDA